MVELVAIIENVEERWNKKEINEFTMEGFYKKQGLVLLQLKNSILADGLESLIKWRDNLDDVTIEIFHLFYHFCKK
jgi:uncharacterized beta-barrel protein YwiB (DUF1934 family)